MHRLFVIFCASAGLLLADAPQDNETLAGNAVEAERRGDFPAAISAFEQLLRKGADSPQLRNNLGIAYFQINRYGEALQQFRTALRKEPDSVPANLFSGLCLLKLERAKDSLPYLERARRAQPNSLETALALARAEVASNELTSARSSYEEAAKLDAQNAEAWYGLGITDRALAEHELKRPDSAARLKSRSLMDSSQEAIAKALQLDPGSVRAYMLLGESFRIAEQYGQAVAEYKEATQRQPNLAAAWAGLATAYSAAGDDASALKAATRALDLDPRDADTTALIAGTFLRQGDYAKAQPYALRALQLQPNLASGHVILAKILLAQHEPAKALPELQAAASDDTDGSTHYLLATTLRQLGKDEEASAAMRKYKALHAAHIGAAVSNP